MAAWGNSNMEAEIRCIHNWAATKVGLERLCATQSDLPLALDDTKTNGTPKLINNSVYAIAEGQGKTRGSPHGLRPTQAWRTIVLSTGEAALSDYCQDGGARARILSLSGFPFHGLKTDEAARFVAQVLHLADHNYGHLTVPWIEYLTTHTDQWAAWRERFHQNASSIVAPTGIIARVANMRAAITTAGQIFHEAGIVPWNFRDPFIALWDAIEQKLDEAEVGKRALNDIYSWCISREESFYGRHQHVHTRDSDVDHVTFERIQPGGWLGRWDVGADWHYIGIFPRILNRALTDMGYDPAAVCALWDQNKWLRRDPDGKHRGLKTRLGKTDARLIAISREAVINVLDLA